jgi:beta-lactamase regulating signal transducer with metallopeptidase domain
MRISDALASETDRVRAAPSAKRTSEAESSRHLRVAYILAVMWVIVALGLYAFQMVRLAAGRA